MRGIATSILILAGIFLLALPIAMHAKAQSQINSGLEARLLLEKMQGDSDEIANAFSQVLRANSENRKGGLGKAESARMDPILSASLALISLEKSLEEKARADGRDLDLWFGDCALKKMELLRRKIKDGKEGAKCKGCFDFTRLSFDFRGKPLPLSSALLFHDGKKIQISKKGLTLMPESYPLGLPESVVCFGASIYHPGTGASAIQLMHEGFE